jgi:hypothetical protein
VSGHEHERLSAYLDGELPPEERALVDAHLSACAECTAFLAALAAADRAAAALPAEAPDGYFDAFPSRVRARIEARRAEARPGRLPAWAWAAAAALVLAVVTPLTLRQLRPEAAPVATAPGESLAREALEPSPATLAPEPKRKAKLESPVPVPAQARPSAPGAGSDFAGEPSGPPPPASAVEARPMLADAPASQAPAGLESPEKGVRARLEAQTAETAVAPRERSAEAVGPAPVGVAADPERAFRRLDAVRPRSAEEWRRLRDDWSAFVAAHPGTPRADEARVRAIEAGYEAWLTAGDPDDEAALRRDAQAYLERADARQAERVRRLVPPRP